MEIVHRTAHAVRSRALHVGATELSRIFAGLESSTATGNEKEVRADVNDVLRRWRDVVALLDDMQDEDRTLQMR